MRRLLLVFCLFTVLLPAQSMAADKVLMMATTTSTADTGLLDDLAPAFQKETGIELKFTATGTGKALEMGRSCNVDVLLVHDPEAEAKFVGDGFGINRVQLMYNDFVMVGPKADPAGIKGKTVAEAMKALSGGKAPFISRGDKSGTHALELRLWKDTGAGVPEGKEWYVEAGQGMMRTIAMCAEKGGYTLTDRGTWIKYEAGLKEPGPLAIVVEKDQKLFNQYSSITVNPAKCPSAKADLADAFTKWMASPSTQKRIADFKLMDKPLFTPNAGK